MIMLIQGWGGSLSFYGPQFVKVSNLLRTYDHSHDFLTLPLRAKEGGSFITILGQRYGQSAVALNLAALMNELHERFPYHFVWAEAPERYQAIIDGLRAEQMEVAIDFEKTTRYATNFQNRIIKGYSALAALDQHEAVIKQGLSEASSMLVASNENEEVVISPHSDQ